MIAGTIFTIAFSYLVTHFSVAVERPETVWFILKATIIITIICILLACTGN